MGNGRRAAKLPIINQNQGTSPGSGFQPHLPPQVRPPRVGGARREKSVSPGPPTHPLPGFSSEHPPPYFCGGAEFAGAVDAGGGVVAVGPGVGVSEGFVLLGLLEFGLLEFGLLEFGLLELGLLEFGLLELGLLEFGLLEFGVVASPAFGDEGLYGLST
jgi:hypothetical protein